MRRLAQKLEEDGTDSELRRYCERILRVRSTGWTQGIFANFAAESMVPKGPEWGGGNWEIKTPTNLKAIPQWELAAEVMPYMKTDDGSIPSIVADHIGVYLGSVKGRGSIVEVVSDDSLVKSFAPAGGNVDKATGLQTPLAKSISNKSKASSDGDSKDNLMGLETLMKQSSSSAAADEQAKAEEEFKKTMYGTANDGSSSDEENVSKTRKLHIRIRDKPVTSPTVDVKKIKEATMQFKLGEGFGPPISRTKSLTGSTPDLAQNLSQPPATTALTAPIVSATPVDPFGTDSLMQPAPVLQPSTQGTGPGVAARPIPEDFFQNTIPSLQIAASLPPPGTYLSQLDPASRGVDSNKVSSNQANAPEVNVGFPDGGVPPQASQQPAVPFEPIGLPDGGVPPQSLGQPTAMPPSVQPVQPAQPSLPSQPIDLSVLGVPNSVDSGKPPPPQATSVRPGQVHKSFLINWCLNLLKKKKKKNRWLNAQLSAMHHSSL